MRGGSRASLRRLLELGRRHGIICAPLLLACLAWETPRSNDGGPPADDPPNAVTRLLLTPERATMGPGQLLTFSVAGVTASGDTAPVAVSWTAARGTLTPATEPRRRGRGRATGLYRAAHTRGEDTVTVIDRSGLADTARIIVLGPPSPGSDVVLVGAGDIASCESDGDEATARILDTIPGIVFTAGDNAYPDGRASDFADCYDPSWGRHKHRTRPALGNHDHRTARGAPFFEYFGANAGERGRGYYSYDVGEWHIVVLNSEARMRRGSAQEQWLRGDLQASDKRCTLAYLHHPTFSSSSHHGSQPQTAPLFQALYDGGAEVVVAGHDHTYERFAPQALNGAADRARGVRQFVVGTGGRSHYDFGTPLPNSESRYNDTPGVIKFTLSAEGYRWAFIPVSGNFRDSGSGTCH